MPGRYLAVITFLLTANATASSLPEGARTVSDASGYIYVFGVSSSPPAATPGAYKPSNVPSSCGTVYRPIWDGGSYPIPCSITYVRKIRTAGNSTVFVACLSYGLNESIVDLDVDSSGNIYVTGRTADAALPTPGAFHTQQGNLFVAKLSADGSALLYAAVFGGESSDFPHAIRVNAAGEAWIAGETGSSKFPTVKPLRSTYRAGTQCGYQPVTSNCATGFVSKLNAAGTALEFSTYLGGSSTDAIFSLALDSTGAAYLTGLRGSSDFPFTPGAFSTDGGVFVTKVAADGSALLYSTALGGTDAAVTNVTFSRVFDGVGWEGGTAVVPAGDGSAVVVGQTHSADFPAGDLSQPFLADTLCDESLIAKPTGVCPSGFVAKLNPAGSGLVYSTLLGGHGYNVPGAVLLDSTGNAYISGSTTATDFPVTTNAFQPCNAATWYADQFSDVLTEIDPRGSLIYSTYFGSGPESASLRLSVDASGSVSATEYLLNGLSTSPAAGHPFQLHFPIDQTPVTSPQFFAGCVLNAATRNFPGDVAPGELLTIRGAGLGPTGGVTAQPDAHGRYPTNLAGSRVLFNGIPAPVLYAQYGQINLVAPLSLAGNSTTQLQIEVQGQATPAVSLPVLAMEPGMFTRNFSGNGPAAVLNQDGSPNSADNPALRGSVVSFFLTGYLPDKSIADGQIATAPTATPGNPLTVYFGVSGNPGETLYAGQAPGLINGIARLDVRIPPDAPTGAQVWASASGVTWGMAFNYISIR